MDNDKYYVRQQGAWEVLGPFAVAEIQEQLRSGGLTHDWEALAFKGQSYRELRRTTDWFRVGLLEVRDAPSRSEPLEPPMPSVPRMSQREGNGDRPGSIWKNVKALIGFLVGAGAMSFILTVVFESMGSASHRHYSPRGAGWIFLIIGAGVGCARLFMTFDLMFFQVLSRRVQVMIVAPISWLLLVLSFVWVFQPFGSYASDDEKWLIAKIVMFPIAAGFIAYFGYRVLFNKSGKPDA